LEPDVQAKPVSSVPSSKQGKRNNNVAFGRVLPPSREQQNPSGLKPKKQPVMSLK
jgi:hypothetical protein